MSSTTKLNLSFLSRLKNTILNKSGALPDITGKTLGEFHADRRMDLPSGEADIYLCSGTGSHAGERFVLKYYRRENAVKQDVLEKLRGIVTSGQRDFWCVEKSKRLAVMYGLAWKTTTIITRKIRSFVTGSSMKIWFPLPGKL